MRNPLARRSAPTEPGTVTDVAAAQPATLPARQAQDKAPESAGFGSYLWYFLGLGTWGFGGPIASVGYMQRDLVERRGWLTEAEFLDGVALGQTMPGPLAAQVVMWVGYLRKGWAGALAAAAAFIAPSFLIVLAVAIVYVRYTGGATNHRGGRSLPERVRPHGDQQLTRCEGVTLSSDIYHFSIYSYCISG